VHIFQLPVACLLQVVRCFEDDDIVHVSGKVDPLDDIDVINLELALADLGQIEKRLDRLRKGEACYCYVTYGLFCSAFDLNGGGEGSRGAVVQGSGMAIRQMLSHMQ
jgi:hypothetical protein